MSAGAIRLRARAAALLAAARVAARHALAARGDLLGRTAFYAVLLVIFSRVWQAVGGTGAAQTTRFLWYFAATEWVLVSIPAVHLDVQRDVVSGDLACLLVRPLPYLALRVSEAVGVLVLRFAALGVVGFPLTALLTGGPPPDLAGFAAALALGAVAGVVGVLFQAGIGVAAVWLQDATPLYWVWQKLLFVFGGLILPLDLYPAGLREAALWTPFAAMLYGPARLATGFDAGAALRGAAALALWGAVAVLALRAVYRRARVVLDVNGG